MLVKEKLHKIIDEIADENILNGFLNLFTSLKEENQGKLFDSLSQEQQIELSISYDESLNDENLISHKEMQRISSKWL